MQHKRSWSWLKITLTFSSLFPRSNGVLMREGVHLDGSAPPEGAKFCVELSSEGATCASDPLKIRRLIETSNLDMGVRQRIDGSETEVEAIKEVLRLMQLYWYDEVLSRDQYKEVRTNCKNNNELCAFWASIGEWYGHFLLPSEEMTIASNIEHSKTQKSTSIDVVFSDLDGTLIHYPKNIDELEQNKKGRYFVRLPPSSTGLKGIISAKTMELCRKIRQSGSKFIFVSGMRTSTLLKRIHYLPKADAYCCEAGGRIFYAVPESTANCFKVMPQPYPGSTKEDLEPFFIVEDVPWRTIMEQTAGKLGFIGNELDSDGTQQAVPVKDREGKLWKHAQTLIEMGYTLDIDGYATCFRVNGKQQIAGVNFNALAMGMIDCPGVLSTSSNLGCLDFYPKNSGKNNCCAYLARKFGDFDTENVLASRCVCLCDDDNDIEMALACLHAYIPSATSESMKKVMSEYSDKFTLTTREEDLEDLTLATENALILVLDRIHG